MDLLDLLEMSTSRTETEIEEHIEVFKSVLQKKKKLLWVK